MDIDPELVSAKIVNEVTSVEVAPDPPRDFKSFWIETRERLNDVPIELEITRFVSNDDSDVFQAEWFANSYEGRRIGGPLIIPKDVKGPQWVYSHGYGNTDRGAARQTNLASKGFIAVGLDARGYNRSRIPGDPRIPGWAVFGVEDRTQYILRGAVADVMRAVDVARAIEGADPERTVLSGGSFSGGLSALAAPWIDNLAYLALRVPTFGAYELRRQLVKRGSGHEINTFLNTLSPGRIAHVMTELRYFDAVNAAPLIRDLPVTVGLGISDVVVPGETVAAIYNALGTNDKELLTYPCSHTDHPLAKRWVEYETHIVARAGQRCGLL